MRVIFEQLALFSETYECHLCGASNSLASLTSTTSLGWVTDGSLDWFVFCIR